MITNFLIAGHYLKSGEIVFDVAEFFVVDASKASGHFTNLFNGNEFMERAGNAIINRNIEVVSQPTVEKSLQKIAKVLHDGFNEIFENFTKIEFEEIFPQNSKPENVEVLDEFSNETIGKINENELKTLKDQISSLFFYVQVIFIFLIIFTILAIFFGMKNFNKKKSTNENHDKTSEKLLQKTAK